MNNRKLIKYAKNIYNEDNSGHNFEHIKRVLKYAKTIYQNEGGDWNIIFISVLFHDVHRIMSNEENKYITPKESLARIRTYLKDLELDENIIKNVLYIIERHEDKSCKTKCLELNIVKDSDILDSLGKIGLKRTIKYCLNKNIPFVDKHCPLDCKEYIYDVNPISMCHYIYRTQIPNANLLVTQTGKELGKEKIRPLKYFLLKYYPNMV